MDSLLLLTIFVSFMLTYLLLPFWIRKAKENGMVARDMHKREGKLVAEGGGVSVLFGTSLGILMYVALKTFYFGSNGEIAYVLALLCVLLLSGLVGMIDDLLGWKKGLSRRSRIILMAFSAIPLMVMNAGDSSIVLPFLGQLELGLLYPLLFIPIGVIGAATTFNFLAGYNGLEASQGVLVLGGLSFAAYLTGNSWLSVLSLYGVATLLAFFIFNMNPAKIFPGDMLTYPIGALIAGIAILGNIEKVAIIFFVPYIIETILKLRGKLVKESFAKLDEKGGLDTPYAKIYGLEHLAIRILRKIKGQRLVKEHEVVLAINGFQLIFIALGISTLL